MLLATVIFVPSVTYIRVTEYGVVCPQWKTAKDSGVLGSYTAFLASSSQCFHAENEGIMNFSYYSPSNMV